MTKDAQTVSNSFAWELRLRGHTLYNCLKVQTDRTVKMGWGNARRKLSKYFCPSQLQITYFMAILVTFCNFIFFFFSSFINSCFGHLKTWFLALILQVTCNPRGKSSLGFRIYRSRSGFCAKIHSGRADYKNQLVTDLNPYYNGLLLTSFDMSFYTQHSLCYL